MRKAIENNALQQMRAKEDCARSAAECSGLLYSRNTVSEDGRFIRRAIGGWLKKLTDAQLKIILAIRRRQACGCGLRAGPCGGRCVLT
jgi:hypothetical protein